MVARSVHIWINCVLTNQKRTLIARRCAFKPLEHYRCLWNDNASFFSGKLASTNLCYSTIGVIDHYRLIDLGNQNLNVIQPFIPCGGFNERVTFVGYQCARPVLFTLQASIPAYAVLESFALESFLVRDESWEDCICASERWVGKEDNWSGLYICFISIHWSTHAAILGLVTRLRWSYIGRLVIMVLERRQNFPLFGILLRV